MEEIRLGLEFQSALPRRERHNCDTIKNRALLISIRAPAKGATRWLCTSDADQVISIRAPAKGATSVSSFFPDTSGFQSALPRRERHKRTDTHWIVFIFQSALPRRERLVASTPLVRLLQFQSALPRRERQETAL